MLLSKSFTVTSGFVSMHCSSRLQSARYLFLWHSLWDSSYAQLSSRILFVEDLLREDVVHEDAHEQQCH
jgi:hypothetical protein